MEFKIVTEEEILNIINSLDNKSSSGCDSLSNTMVKSLKNELYMPLILIINQMLRTGIYPNAFKIAKIMPIFKKGDPSLLTVQVTTTSFSGEVILYYLSNIIYTKSIVLIAMYNYIV